jgi:hypothetical protein
VRKGHARALAIAAAIGVAVVVTSAGSAVATGSADRARMTVRQQLTGYQEDPLVLSTTGTAQFRITVNPVAQTLTYQLSYSALEGNITQAHIHIGGRAQSGGISVFICTNLGNGPAGTQACPPAPATVTGTLTPADVIGPAGQGVAAGQFDEVVAAFRAGKTYVNVHSSLYPGGEIRAQLDHQH